MIVLIKTGGPVFNRVLRYLSWEKSSESENGVQVLSEIGIAKSSKTKKLASSNTRRHHPITQVSSQHSKQKDFSLRRIQYWWKLTFQNIALKAEDGLLLLLLGVFFIRRRIDQRGVASLSQSLQIVLSYIFYLWVNTAIKMDYCSLA